MRSTVGWWLLVGWRWPVGWLAVSGGILGGGNLLVCIYLLLPIYGSRVVGRNHCYVVSSGLAPRRSIHGANDQTGENTEADGQPGLGADFHSTTSPVCAVFVALVLVRARTWREANVPMRATTGPNGASDLRRLCLHAHPTLLPLSCVSRAVAQARGGMRGCHCAIVSRRG